MLNKADIEKYFMAEKNESLVFVVIGLIAIGVAIYFYLSLKTSFYKGAAIPLLVVGLIQVIAGYAVYARSNQQRISNVYAYDMDPRKLRAEELPRIKEVNKRFVIYRWIEISLLVIGITTLFLCRADATRNFWCGLGITLAMQAGLMLASDHFAEKRAGVYTKQLEIFIEGKKPLA